MNCHGNQRGILWRNSIEPCQVWKEAALRYLLWGIGSTSLVFMAFFYKQGGFLCIKYTL